MRSVYQVVFTVDRTVTEDILVEVAANSQDEAWELAQDKFYRGEGSIIQSIESENLRDEASVHRICRVGEMDLEYL